METYKQLSLGEPAPWFRQRSTSSGDFVFDVAAGRYLVLGFFLTASDEGGRAMLDAIASQRARFDDDQFSFFGISLDPNDEASQRVRESLPGMRHFWDFDGKVARLYGALPQEGGDAGSQQARRMWVVLDPALHVIGVFFVRKDGADRERLFKLLDSLPPVARHGGIEMHAPVIMLPNVFGPELCRRLIDAYETHGGKMSGFMRDVDGKTVGVHDTSYKRRDDHNLDDDELRRAVQQRVQLVVTPAIRRVHSFDVTRMERYIVGCYDSESSGHFRPHRDNTTKGTAHRRFALSVNLNNDFEGGELSFPEYGPRSYKMPAGGAIVFSGSLLHAVSQVTRGRRYAFLPFLYDEAAAQVREANNPHLGDEVGAYKAEKG